MPIYLVSGKLGSGKSLACVGRIRDALLEGRRVATNLDLNLEKLLPAKARKVDCVRVPDKPTVDDFEALGCGNPEMDETKNGLIVLDELGSWLNARSFNDRARQPVIDWLIHSRKHGWDVYFICQNIQQIDKQVRESLVEYLVACRRLDRMKIPLVGSLLSFLSGGLLSGRMPKVHLGVVKYGTEQHAMVAERWIYLGRDLYPAYNTRQVFSSTYEHGAYSYLTPWHLVGRHEQTRLDKLIAALRSVLGDGFMSPSAARKPHGKPSDRLAPLMQLPPETRWRVARQLVESGAL